MSNVEEYDPKTNMPTERSGGTWAVYKGRIYVAGGEHQDTRLLAAFRALEAYDPGQILGKSCRKRRCPDMDWPVPSSAIACILRAAIPIGCITGMRVVTDSHDIFEFSNR